MGLSVEKRRRFTIAEYLQMEHASQEKHEFFDGEMLDMAGGTYSHAMIAGNTVVVRISALIVRTCRIVGSDLRIRIPRKTIYMYPDASIICGKPQFDPDDASNSSITNPRVIIEGCFLHRPKPMTGEPSSRGIGNWSRCRSTF